MIINAYIKDTAPEKGTGLRLAVYQGKGAAGTRDAINDNIDRLEELVATAKTFNVQLISFPELYLSGYAITPEAAHELAMEVTDTKLEQVASIAKRHETAIICPYPEKASVAGEIRYYDSIAVFAKDGLLL